MIDSFEQVYLVWIHFSVISDLPKNLKMGLKIIIMTYILT